MAEPEIPEVRAEIQREDRPFADPTYAGQRRGASTAKWIGLILALVIVAVLAGVLLS
jgi:hypothetical protein